MIHALTASEDWAIATIYISTLAAGCFVAWMFLR